MEKLILKITIGSFLGSIYWFSFRYEIMKTICYGLCFGYLLGQTFNLIDKMYKEWK